MATWLEKLRKINERTKEQEKLAREMTHRPQADIESLRGQDPLTDWGLGVRERTLSPLSTLAGEAKRFQELSPQEMGMEMVGGGMAGTFIGKGAKTWKAAMKDTAEQLEKQGVPPEEIWKQTGTFRGADKEWRQEIPDDMASMKNLPINKSWEDVSRKLTPGKSAKEFNAYKKARSKLADEYDLTNRTMRPVEDIYSHPQLYKEYPELLNLSAYHNPRIGKGGSYGGGKIEFGDVSNTEGVRGLFGHELQHAIQQREGWARGGSPETVFNSGTGAKGRDEQFAFAKQAYEKSHQTSGDPLLAELFSDVKPWESLTDREKLGWLDQGRNEAYRNLAGEAEARLTQARMNMTPEQRAASYPPSMFDVPMENQIVRMSDLAR